MYTDEVRWCIRYIFAFPHSHETSFEPKETSYRTQQQNEMELYERSRLEERTEGHCEPDQLVPIHVQVMYRQKIVLPVNDAYIGVSYVGRHHEDGDHNLSVA